MSRAETTAMLSKLVEKRLRNQTAFWASEVNFDRNTPDEARGLRGLQTLEHQRRTGARKRRERLLRVLRGQVMHG